MFNYPNNYTLMQLQCDKQLQIYQTQMKYKMESIHRNTLASFKETCEIVEKSNNNILIGNAKNKLGTIIFASNTFFQSMEREIQQILSENYKKILWHDYQQRINDYQVTHFDYLKSKSMLPGILTYAGYYNDVLSRNFPKKPIDLVNINGVIDIEKDNEKMQTLLYNYSESTHINEKITQKIKKDPIKYSNITYDNEKKKFDDKAEK